MSAATQLPMVCAGAALLALLSLVFGLVLLQKRDTNPTSSIGGVEGKGHLGSIPASRTKRCP